MPKPRKKDLITCKYYCWKLGSRNGVFFADGRSGNPIDLGRQSLGTKEKAQALEALKSLDEQMAVQQGLITKEELHFQNEKSLELEEGWRLYRDHVTRPRVVGGAKAVSAKRYRAVFDKFIAFAKSRGIKYWQQVTSELLEAYAGWLDDEEYAYRTEYLEITTLKQAVNWLVENDHLPANIKIKMTLRKPTGTDTYCWKEEEVAAQIELCRQVPSLQWLGGVLTALASTGLRISELASLKWSDIDPKGAHLLLTDESYRSPNRTGKDRRETKSSRSRSFPISPAFGAVLQQMDRARGGAIFRGPLGGKLKPDTVRNVLIREVLAPLAGRFPSLDDKPGFKDGRLHSYRHYFCTICVQARVPEMDVKDWLGHRDSAMVRHYYHINNQEAQRRMSKINFIGSAGSTVLSVSSGSEDAKAVERTAS